MKKLALILLILLVSAPAAMARVSFTASTDNPSCIPTHGPDGAMRVDNPLHESVAVTLHKSSYTNPVVFELGANDRHWRRVYPISTQSNSSIGIPPLTNDQRFIFHASPETSYKVWRPWEFADHVLISISGVDPTGMKDEAKLKQLARTLFDLSASRATDESAAKMRLVTDAYQALIGVQFDCRMDYTAEHPADYRAFAGRAFPVVCRIANKGAGAVGPCSVRIIAPDEWRTSTVGTPSAVAPGMQTKEFRFTVTAPSASTRRAKTFPVIAELSFKHLGRPLVIHYPITVELAPPFTAALKITSSDADTVKADVLVQNGFPGITLKDVTATPYIPQSLGLEPNEQSISFSDKGIFHVTYRRTGAPGFALRAANVQMRADEHLVQLRAVLEAYLPLSRRTRSEALWMNDNEDGRTVSETIGDRRCRRTTGEAQGTPRCMYFALSPNFPATGKTYVTVTYFDDGEGSFRLQYDSAGEAYRDSSETVKVRETRSWKKVVFVLPDAVFANRQNAESDFRLITSGTDLAVEEIAVSKFLPGQTQN